MHPQAASRTRWQQLPCTVHAACFWGSFARSLQLKSPTHNLHSCSPDQGLATETEPDIKGAACGAHRNEAGVPLELLESLRGDGIPGVLRVVVQDNLSPGAVTSLVTPCHTGCRACRLCSGRLAARQQPAGLGARRAHRQPSVVERRL